MVLLERTIKQKFVNAFNSEIASNMVSDMNLQCIVNVYYCVSYLVNYINKMNCDVSDL